MILDKIQSRAQNLGLAAVGVAPAVEEVLARFPWAQSVICAALSYLPPEEPPPDARPRGLVARFARGVDYHLVLRQKLQSLREIILGIYPDALAEVCVDTTRIPERKLAVLSGIGFRGWNANVFVGDNGSWVVLGEIVTDLRLPPNPNPQQNKCAECKECMKRCPTQAIKQPYVVDRNLCLSDVTQRRGVIPPELRLKLGNRVYGCDVCQEVCPLNRDVAPSTPEFARRVFPGAHPDLIELMLMTEDDFQARVRHSSIGWIGRSTIRRNAAVAAGNLESEEAVSALEQLAQDVDPAVAEHATWAIERIRQRLSR
ncbi:MAG: tRNA epoxyqueuosine(34) reductase QueG [Armatimonadota bacterium]|nr:tRNA epoxyqueuosine(34) reductase QueG [Armatimonadota bacterium]